MTRLDSTTAREPASRGSRWLSGALLIDGVVTGLNGAAYLVVPVAVAEWLGPDPGVLRGIGWFLVSYAVLILIIARQRPVPIAGAWFAVALNIMWTSASAMTAALGALSLTNWGRIWAVTQGLVVATFAVAQLIGIRCDRGDA